MSAPVTLLSAILAAVVALLVVAHIALAAATAALDGRTESTFPPLGERVDVDGRALHYRARGPRGAAAIVLVHGAGANLRDLDATLAPPLAARYRVIAVDRPGSGWSEAAGSEAGELGRQAAAIDALLGALGVERALWVGHSFGGAVALAALVERPERVAGAVLLAAPTAPWDGAMPWPIRLGAVPFVGELFARTWVVPFGRHGLEDLLRDSFKPEAPPEPIARYAEATAAALGVTAERFRATARDLVGLSPALARLAPRLDAIERPLLLVHGERDPAMDPTRHAEPLAASVDTAELVLLPGAGHLIHHTRSDEVIELIEGFARRVLGDRRESPER